MVTIQLPKYFRKDYYGEWLKENGSHLGMVVEWMYPRVEIRFFPFVKSTILIKVNFLILQKLSKHLTNSFTEN